MKKFLISSICALVLGLAGFIYGMSQQGLTGATRAMTAAFGGLSVDAQIALMQAATFGGVALMVAGIVLTIIAIKKKSKK
jgi:hypothetical protein